MLREWYHRLAAMLHVSGRDAKDFAASFLAALVIWLVYTMTQTAENELSVAVLIESDIPGHCLQASYPVTVSATCECAYSKAVTMGSANERHARVVKVESSALRKKSDTEYVISSSDLRSRAAEIFGPNVIFKSFLDDSYTVTFELENSKMVPVVPVSMLTFKPECLTVEGLTVSPDSVLVYGEPQVLRDITYVTTDVVRLKKLSSSKNGHVSLDAPGGIRLSQDKVSYNIDVTRFMEIVRKDVHVGVKGVPQGHSLIVLDPVATVTFRCKRSMMDEGRTSEVEIFVDYADFLLSRDGHCVARYSELPDGVLTCSVEPEIFECMEEGSK